MVISSIEFVKKLEIKNKATLKRKKKKITKQTMKNYN